MTDSPTVRLFDTENTPQLGHFQVCRCRINSLGLTHFSRYSAAHKLLTHLSHGPINDNMSQNRHIYGQEPQTRSYSCVELLQHIIKRDAILISQSREGPTISHLHSLHMLRNHPHETLVTPLRRDLQGSLAVVILKMDTCAMLEQYAQGFDAALV